MRVALVNPYLPPPVGGIEREMINLHRCLDGLGHSPVLVTSKAKFPTGRHRADEYSAFLGSAEALRLRGYLRSTLRGFHPSRAPLLLPFLFSVLRSLRPDALIFFNIGWPLTAMRVVKRFKGTVPSILRTYYHTPGGRLAGWKDRLLFRFIASFDAGICATEVEREQIIGRGFNLPDKLRVIPPGVRFYEITREERQAFLRKRGLEARLVVSHVGRLSEFKGTGRLVRALGDLRRRLSRPPALLLIGRCDDEGWLEDQVKRCAEPGEVVRTGEILDERELRLAVGASDLFALPSDYESFGLVFLEAMAAGVPVIAPKTGGVPDLVEHGRQGFLLNDPGDRQELKAALLRLVQSPELRSKMGSSGASRARERFSWEGTTLAYLDLIQAINERRSAGV